MNGTIPEPSTLTYAEVSSAAYLKHTEFDASPSHRNRLASIIAMLNPAKFEPQRTRILEIGCGVGNIAIPLASLGYSIIGVDIHEGSVRIAREKNPFSNASFDARDFRELDVSGFDAIILTEVLEHVSEYDDMLEAIASRMKPGARFIVTTPNGRAITEMLLRPSYFLKRFALWATFVKMVKKGLHTRDLTTANLQTPHVNFFSQKSIGHAFHRHRFRVTAFHRYFVNWALYETFFSQSKLSEDAARADFIRSQKSPASVCALWTFLLEKEET